MENLLSDQNEEAGDNAQLGLKRPLGQSNFEDSEDIPNKKSVDNDQLEDHSVIVIETFKIPENVVGLVIGKGGSEIKNIQQSSECRIQMEPTTNMPNEFRGCQLEGTPQAIAIAKELINKVIVRHQNNSESQSVPIENETKTEILIPADKCGLVIGKSGETIKHLQEQSGCRMNIIQDSQSITGQPKPLRIVGSPEAIEVAKNMVNNLMNSYPGNMKLNINEHGNNNNRFSNSIQNNSFSGGQMAKGEVIVPRNAAGFIIGKGGETIKRLSFETGTKIQFKPDEDPNSLERCAVIMGTREQIFSVTERITEIVKKSISKVTNSEETYYLHVPADKCGLVIGKGGEIIKQIIKETGACCGLVKGDEPSNNEKVFYIRGTASEINHASHLMRMKVGDVAPNSPVPPLQSIIQSAPQQSVEQLQNNGLIANYQTVCQQQTGQNQYIQSNGTQYEWRQGFPANYQQQKPLSIQTNLYSQQFQQPSQYYSQQTPEIYSQSQSFENLALSTVPTSPTTGLPDYSSHWAVYYRSIGLFEQAAMVEGQIKLKAMEASRSTNQGAGDQLMMLPSHLNLR